MDDGFECIQNSREMRLRDPRQQMTHDFQEWDFGHRVLAKTGYHYIKENGDTLLEKYGDGHCLLILGTEVIGHGCNFGEAMEGARDRNIHPHDCWFYSVKHPGELGLGAA